MDHLVNETTVDRKTAAIESVLKLLLEKRGLCYGGALYDGSTVAYDAPIRDELLTLVECFERILRNDRSFDAFHDLIRKDRSDDEAFYNLRKEFPIEEEYLAELIKRYSVRCHEKLASLETQKPGLINQLIARPVFEYRCAFTGVPIIDLASFALREQEIICNVEAALGRQNIHLAIRSLNVIESNEAVSIIFQVLVRGKSEELRVRYEFYSNIYSNGEPHCIMVLSCLDHDILAHHLAIFNAITRAVVDEEISGDGRISLGAILPYLLFCDQIPVKHSGFIINSIILYDVIAGRSECIKAQDGHSLTREFVVERLGNSIDGSRYIVLAVDLQRSASSYGLMTVQLFKDGYFLSMHGNVLDFLPFYAQFAVQQFITNFLAFPENLRVYNFYLGRLILGDGEYLTLNDAQFAQAFASLHALRKRLLPVDGNVGFITPSAHEIICECGSAHKIIKLDNGSQCYECPSKKARVPITSFDGLLYTFSKVFLAQVFAAVLQNVIMTRESARRDEIMAYDGVFLGEDKKFLGFFPRFTECPIEKVGSFYSIGQWKCHRKKKKQNDGKNGNGKYSYTVWHLLFCTHMDRHNLPHGDILQLREQFKEKNGKLRVTIISANPVCKRAFEELSYVIGQQHTKTKLVCLSINDFINDFSAIDEAIVPLELARDCNGIRAEILVYGEAGYDKFHMSRSGIKGYRERLEKRRRRGKGESRAEVREKRYQDILSEISLDGIDVKSPLTKRKFAAFVPRKHYEWLALRFHTTNSSWEQVIDLPRGGRFDELFKRFCSKRKIIKASRGRQIDS